MPDDRVAPFLYLQRSRETSPLMLDLRDPMTWPYPRVRVQGKTWRAIEHTHDFTVFEEQLPWWRLREPTRMVVFPDDPIWGRMDYRRSR